MARRRATDQADLRQTAGVAVSGSPVERTEPGRRKRRASLERSGSRPCRLVSCVAHSGDQARCYLDRLRRRLWEASGREAEEASPARTDSCSGAWLRPAVSCCACPAWLLNRPTTLASAREVTARCLPHAAPSPEPARLRSAPGACRSDTRASSYGARS